MSLEKTLSAPNFHTSSIVIDWSSSGIDSERRQTGLKCDPKTLLTWVQSCPSAKSVHVVLGSIQQREKSRSLQRSLQALGCRVTRRG